jgi:signal transduction histidine kinase
LRARQLVPTRPFRLPADSAAAQNGDFTRRRTPGETVRVLPVVLPVVFAGGVAITIAAWTFVGTKPSWSQLAGIFVLLAASTVAEAFPVPIEGVAVGATSLANVFIVATAVIYGWRAAAIVGCLAMALVEIGRRRPFSRVAYNASLYVGAAIAAGGAAAGVGTSKLAALVLATLAGSTSFYLVDIALLAAVVARAAGESILPSLRRYLYLTLVPFAVVASLTVILVVLWDRSPWVAIVLVGPLLAIALYQRWIHGALSRLREFDRLKDEFIAIVSHELRTPLTSVYGAAATLQRYDLDEERREALLAIVANESARLGRLLDDVLWASRIESGATDTSVRSIDAVDLTADIVDATRAHLPPGLTLELGHPTPAPWVVADPDKLRQVLVNLLENAVKYSADGGHVEVKLEPRDGKMRFSVSDEGLGIPAEELERIFEKFHRLDPNMTQGVGGTGLGLYICRELVERMNGRIWVESEVGRGSTFTFELPLADE